MGGAMMDVVPAAALGSGLLVLLGAALHDVAARTVPNRACLLIAAAGLVVQAVQGSLLVSIPAALAVFVVAALCWRRGWMGGGDVKLFGAVSLLIPPEGILAMLCATALAGGGLAVVYLVGRRYGRGRSRSGLMPALGRSRPATVLRRVMRAEGWRLRRGGPMPYAVAIACGTFYVLSHGGLS